MSINIHNINQSQNYRNNYKKSLKLYDFRQNIPTQPENYRIRTQLSPKNWKDYIAPQILADTVVQHQQRSKRKSDYTPKIKNQYQQKNYEEIYQRNDDQKSKSSNKQAYLKKLQGYRRKKSQILNKIRLLQNNYQPVTFQKLNYENDNKKDQQSQRISEKQKYLQKRIYRQQQPIDFIQSSEIQMSKRKKLQERIKILQQQVYYLPTKFQKKLKEELFQFQQRIRMK